MNDAVTLAFPAQTQNVALARRVTAVMAARADLPLDRLEDARLAVDEAVSQVIADAPPGAEVVCVFEVQDHALDIVVTAPSSSGSVPPKGTFSWTVLTALANTVTATVDGGVVVLHLHVTPAISVDV